MLAGGPADGPRALRVLALAQLGRVAAYAAAGTLVAALGAPALGWLDREAAFRLLQWAGATAVTWIGLSTAGLVPPLSVIDRVMAPVAEAAARVAGPARGRPWAPLAAGISWGLMPCAMVYAALFTAMLAGSAGQGGLVMLAFGAGTLPGLLAATLGVGVLSRAAARRPLRLAAGLAIAGLGLLTVWVPHPANDALCAEPTVARLSQP